MKHITILLIAITGTLSASGQEQLSKEITIERDIVPEVHAATRPGVFPKQLKFTTTPRSIDAINYGRVSDFGPHTATLEPATPLAAAPLTPYRGYVNAGYFPAANASLSAGYSIISHQATSLNIWGQFNNRQYKSEPLDGLEKQTFKHLEGRIGMDFFHRFGNLGTLELSTDVNLSAFRQPWSAINRSIAEATTLPDATTAELPDMHSQSTIGWNFSALWDGKASPRLNYHIGAGFNLYNFSKSLPAAGDADLSATEPALSLPALHQTGFNLTLGAEKLISDIASFGADIDASFLHYNSYLPEETLLYASGALTDYAQPDESATLPGGKTLGIASITPYYRAATGTYSVKIGARIDFTFHSGKAFHIAPDVLLGVTPAEGFGASLRIGGGEKLNPVQELVQFSPYICQSMAYGVSNRPITADLALRFGPVKGASITLDVAYAAANNWLMPYTADNLLAFSPTRIRALKAGATARWTFRRLLALEVKFESVFGNGDKHSWLEWRDRARRVLGASLQVDPLRNLGINLSYELRMKRSMPAYGIYTPMDEIAPAPEAPSDFNLRNVSMLNLGAQYRITQAFTVFGRVENLLDTRSYIMPLLPAQGLTGMVGIGYKF